MQRTGALCRQKYIGYTPPKAGVAAGNSGIVKAGIAAGVTIMLSTVGYATVYLPFYSEAGIARREEVRQQRTETREAKLSGGGLQTSRAPTSGSMWTAMNKKAERND
jgi:hypothetical protein